jgi:hypothetical protein
MKIRWTLLLCFTLSLSASAQSLETTLPGVGLADAQARVLAAINA